MNPLTGPVHRARLALALLGLTLLASGATRADTTYKIQPILKLRDTVPGTQLKAYLRFEIDPLNDKDQFLFGTATTPSVTSTTSEMKFFYDNGTFTPIVLPEGDAPIGKWPKRVDIWSPVSMNQSGNAVFSLFDIDLADRNKPAELGTFLWDYQAQKVTAVALQGMPAVQNLTFGRAGGNRPSINNHGDIALVAEVKDASGTALGFGVLFREPDGKLLPVALPGQELPGGLRLQEARSPTINDAGRVAFVAVAQGGKRSSAYLWPGPREAGGTITPLAQIDTDAPGGGKIKTVPIAFVNNKNHSVLVAARLGNADTGPFALYRAVEGRLMPVVVPGQPMPDGGKFRTLLSLAISVANDAGQHAFFASLQDGHTAAYLLDADGNLSLILKSGTPTELGQLSGVGWGNGGDSFGISLNNKGQVALGIKIAGLPTMIALLTPVVQ